MSVCSPTLPADEGRHNSGRLSEVWETDTCHSSFTQLLCLINNKNSKLYRFAWHVLSSTHQDSWLPCARHRGGRSGQFPEEDVGDDTSLRSHYPAEVALRLQAGGKNCPCWFVCLFGWLVGSKHHLKMYLTIFITLTHTLMFFSLLLTVWTTAGAGWLRCSTWSLWQTSRLRCCSTFLRWVLCLF